MPIFLIIWLGVSVFVLGLLIVLRPNKNVTWLLLIALLAAFSIWVSLPNNPGIHIDNNNDGEFDIDKEITIRQGLDLAGGLKVLLEADLAPDEELKTGSMEEVRRIVEDRIDSLGALEPVVQLQGERRLIIELPGYEDPENAVSLIKETAQLEFVDFGTSFIAPGTPINTTLGLERAGLTEDDVEGEILETVMTGDIIQTADIGYDELGQVAVNFSLTTEGTKEFGDYTSEHVGQVLGIVLDGVVVSSPTINSAITGGQGTITGEFEVEEASRLATQLRYGSLPISLRVDSTSTVGPTLGQISVEQSIRAGIIGIAVVILFMLIYYRLPGVSAALALLLFAAINLAIYKLVPVTMTLPAITGFLISVGTAVDGNILIFERMKEELRAGKRVGKAVEAGFDRAWASIRDSNFSTIIICIVLWSFGTSFGAGAVRGFAVTLGLGLVVNLFTAVIVTRTFLHFILMPFQEQALSGRQWLLGLQGGSDRV